MRLPHAEQAVVPLEKIEDYLLNPGHPIGGSKAAFFRAFGFSREEWRLLAEALREHGRANPVAKAMSDEDGTTYLVEGPLETPFGRRPRLRTVWLVETGKLAPRFITAYPLPV
jgi:filamentous hemagglutinin